MSIHVLKVCMLEIYACLFFSFPTTLQLNRLFWAASWALRAPHKGEEDTARHSQRAFRLANTVPFDSPHSSDFSQAAEIAGWKGERESERKEKGEKNDRKDWIAQGESQGTEQKKGRGRKETEEELWMSMRSLIYILFVLCEHLRIISIQIRSGAQTPRRLSTNETSACLTLDNKTISHDCARCRPAFNFSNGALAATNLCTVR